MKKRLLLISTLLTATVLVACGGGGDETVKAASADLSMNITASTAAALQGSPLTFGGGVSDLGATGTTTLSVSGTTTNTYSISASNGQASGALNFGSCIFDAGSSTFPAGSPLASGQRPTISKCLIAVRIAGASANGVKSSRKMNMILNAIRSDDVDVTVSITPEGVVTVYVGDRAITVGTVPVVTQTSGGGV